MSKKSVPGDGTHGRGMKGGVGIGASTRRRGSLRRALRRLFR